MAIRLLEFRRPVKQHHRFQPFESKSDLEQLIGNTIPVTLAKHVARAVLEYLKDPDLYVTTGRTIQLKLFDVSNEPASFVRK